MFLARMSHHFICFNKLLLVARQVDARHRQAPQFLIVVLRPQVPADEDDVVGAAVLEHGFDVFDAQNNTSVPSTSAGRLVANM